MDYSSVRVLVVDDEPAIRESLVCFLEDYDFVVSPARSAEEALELLAKSPRDVAIIDLRLPEMSGETLIMQVYEMFPVIVLPHNICVVRENHLFIVNCSLLICGLPRYAYSNPHRLDRLSPSGRAKTYRDTAGTCVYQTAAGLDYTCRSY